MYAWTAKKGYGMCSQTYVCYGPLELPANGGPGCQPRLATQLRLVSVFRQEWITILVALLNHSWLPRSRFVPAPWTQAEQASMLRVPIKVQLAA
jgi:hypothetical protein